MKYLYAAFEGFSAEPSEDLLSNTPLEVAKIPSINECLKSGKLARVQHVSSTVEPYFENACLSFFGVDSKKILPAIGPMEYIAINGSCVYDKLYFKCDLVTVAEDILIDPYAGHPPFNERKDLLQKLNDAFKEESIEFLTQEGYGVVAQMPLSKFQDYFLSTKIKTSIELKGQSWLRAIPKGAGHDFLRTFYAKAQALLEGHDVNRVRVDLGENPANMIWLWGAGIYPKINSLGLLYDVSKAVVVTNSSYVEGLAATLGIQVVSGLEQALSIADVVFFIKKRLPVDDLWDAKRRLVWIEECDRELKEIVSLTQSSLRVAVTTDFPVYPSKVQKGHGAVPSMIAGASLAVDASVKSYSEKGALSSELVFENGYDFLNYFLNK